MGDRIRGRRGVALRKARLAAEPLCRRCKERGLATAATTVDHIVPLALGGEDVDENCRSLCRSCHYEVGGEQFGHMVKRAIAVDGWPEGQ